MSIRRNLDDLLDHDGHDIIVDGQYKKRCYCQKCTHSFDIWAQKQKEEGRVTCKRKCITLCEIKCEKPVTTVYNWGYKKEYEGKWESFKDNKAESYLRKEDYKGGNYKGSNHNGGYRDRDLDLDY